MSTVNGYWVTTVYGLTTHPTQNSNYGNDGHINKVELYVELAKIGLYTG